ncbi:YegP family protein [Tundrisphaera lichenicola]|uniref:YegP family protein n=1 Tax=Tundrisphaera lichenicola TaxID=2029860 RepID=UPI003EBDA435
MAAKFDLKTAKDGQFMFNLKAANGEIILTSELYRTKQGAEGGIAATRANGADDAKFERKTSKSDQPYFVLKAANGETIGQSEMYSSTAAMEKGIESVRTNAPVAVISDMTEA